MKPRLGDPDGIAFYVDAEGLRQLPWELLHDGNGFLCACRRAPFTPVYHNPRARSGSISIANRPLRMLFMACAPEALAALNFEREEALILEATETLRGQQLALVVEESGSRQGLRENFKYYGGGYFDALHLSGHADFDTDGRPVFAMEDTFGEMDQVTADELAEAMNNAWNRGWCFYRVVALVRIPLPRCRRCARRWWRQGRRRCLAGRSRLAMLQPHRRQPPFTPNSLKATLFIARSPTPAANCIKKSPMSGICCGCMPMLRRWSRWSPCLRPRQRERLLARKAEEEFLDARRGSAAEQHKVCPAAEFVGRRRLLQRGLRCLRATQGQPEYAEGLLLSGIGGYGKSSLAARLCQRMSGYRRLVIVGALNETDLLGKLQDQLSSEEAVAALNQSGLTLKQRLRNLFQHHLDEQPFLLVLDGFERNCEGYPNDLRLDNNHQAVLRPDALNTLSALLWAIRQSGSEPRLIVTCRYRFVLPAAAGARLAEFLTGAF